MRITMLDWSRLRMSDLEELNDIVVLKKIIRSSHCLAFGTTPCDVAHVRSKGSGGTDVWWNMIPLCRKAHSAQHSVGWLRFCFDFPRVRFYLEIMGWTIDPNTGKMWNDKLKDIL